MARDGRIPGLSMAVVAPDGVVCAGGLGAADLATGVLDTASTRYLWFSMTKILTATAALRLADEGHLDLEAPASEHVPGLATRRSTGPTVRQLLNHTAGLTNPLPLRWVHPADAPAPDPDALLDHLLSRRRAYAATPGGAARYSNVGYLALGAVIADAAGRPYEQYVTDAVLAPTGMTRTGFHHPADAAATGYVRAPRPADPLLRRILPAGVTGPRHGPYLSLRRFAVDGPAYGGLIGDVVDAARFVQLHLRDGELDGRRVLQASTARAMRVIDRPGKPFAHGLGWFRAPAAERSHHVEHWGAGAGFWNVMRLYPEAGMGVVLMTNSTTRPPFEPVLDALTRTAEQPVRPARP